MSGADKAEVMAVVNECLALLDQHRDRAPRALTVAQLPSLLDQARELLDETRGVRRAEIASIHHLACTGGTLFAKCLAAMPNTCLISELDPLARHPFDRRLPKFAPTDLLGHLNYLRQHLPASVTAQAYGAALRSVYEDLVGRGLRLVIRDHPHSHYHTGDAIADRPSHLALLHGAFRARSVITVRDPAESWLSLRGNGWVQFQPGDFDEYCRRYLVFLEDHDHLALFRYEDLVAEPETVMRSVCAALGLSYVDGFEMLIEALPMTGDSGRGGSRIRAHPPKPRPEGFEAAADASEHYHRLKARLGY